MKLTNQISLFSWPSNGNIPLNFVKDLPIWLQQFIQSFICLFFIFTCICPSMCLSICLFLHFVCFFIHLSIHPLAHSSSTHLFILSVHLFICSFIQLFVTSFIQIVYIQKSIYHETMSVTCTKVMTTHKVPDFCKKAHVKLVDTLQGESWRQVYYQLYLLLSLK